MKTFHLFFLLLLLAFSAASPARALAQPDLEQRVSNLEHRVSSDQEDIGVAVLFCATFLALWAQNTGRNAWLWFFLGLFFSVIVVFVMLYKNSKDKKTGRK